MIRMDSGGGGRGPDPGGPLTSSLSVTSVASVAGAASILGNEYDWSSEENANKWRGLFVEPLQKVLVQVHPQFTAKDDALEYVESLLIRLLAMLTAKPAPLTIADVEVR